MNPLEPPERYQSPRRPDLALTLISLLAAVIWAWAMSEALLRL